MVQDMRLIELKGVCKSFGDTQVLRDVDLYIRKCEFITLLGPSGCGKTTLLRIIGGFEMPTSGEVLFEGKDMTGIPPYKRRINTVFQKYALFNHLNVFDNIAFGLNLKTPEQLGVKTKAEKKAEIERRVSRMLKLVKMEGYGKRSIDALSGGQQQRIAIARALATDPKVLLCDEATSALDPKTTHQILELIREINQRLGLTVIVITHQMSVVQEICNRVAILENGSVVEEGDVAQVFTDPQAFATQTLVYPEMADGSASLVADKTSTQRIRLIFNGSEAASQPLLAQMAIDCGVLASVHNASMRTVGGRMYGYMLIEIPGGPEEMSRAVCYLRKQPLVSVQTVGRYPAQGEAAASAAPSSEEGGAL